MITSTHIQAQDKNEKKRKYPNLTVSVDVQSTLSLQQTFEYVVPIDLEHIFNERYKNIPAIDSTSNEKAWYTAGMTRTVYFDDGTTSDETLLTLTPHSGFTYRVTGFTSALRRLIRQINGSWTFTELDNGKIRIAWTYEFIPKNFIARFLVNIIVKKRVHIVMTNALRIIKEALESGNLYQYKRRVGNW